MSDLRLAMHYIRRNKGMIFIIIIQTVICAFLVGFLYQSFSRQDYSLEHLEKYLNDKNLFALSEEVSAHPDLEQKVYRADNMKNLNKLYHSLLEDKRYETYVINDQHAEVYDIKKIPKECWIDGDDGPKVFDGRVVSAPNTIQFNEKNFTTANIKIREGRKFSKEDYYLRDKKIIPVILGDKYRGILNVGDSFDAVYHEHIKYEVIGFAKKGSLMLRQNSLENIDTYMIIPAFNDLDTATALTAGDRKYTLIMQISAGVFTDMNKEQLEADINKKIMASGCDDLYNMISVNPCIKKPSSLLLSRKSSTLLIFIAIIFAVFILIEMTIFINRQIQKNHRLYAVCFISGADTENIKSSIMYLISIIGLLTAFVYIIFYVTNLILYIIPPFDPMVGIYLIMLIMIVSLVYPIIKINKYSVAELMKRK